MDVVRKIATKIYIIKRSNTQNERTTWWNEEVKKKIFKPQQKKIMRKK